MPVGAYRRTKYTCYFSSLTMSCAFSLPPLLFMTFREMYGVSYTLLGTLVLVNFCTQLAVDLIFTFFGKWFNIRLTVRVMPMVMAAGLLVYAVAPALLPRYAYAGLLAGTVVFSVSAGLNEVLISPLVAALPSDDPGRDMSTLHSLFGYGVLMVVVISTAFLKLFGTQNWMYLVALFAAFPVLGSILFCLSPIPDISLSHPDSAGGEGKFGRQIVFCGLCIFLGSTAENTMTNWICTYLENTLGLSKTASDVLGLATFAMLLAFTRTLYAKHGKNITRTLFWSMVGAVICYMAAGLSPSMPVALAACMLTGMCTSMLWPGTLILMEERVPVPGVAAYALMAACGDLGGSAGPQLLGVVVDAVTQSSWAAQLGSACAMSAEQIGMRVGMLMGALFPLAGVALLLPAWKKSRSAHKKEKTS